MQDMSFTLADGFPFHITVVYTQVQRAAMQVALILPTSGFHSAYSATLMLLR